MKKELVHQGDVQGIESTLPRKAKKIDKKPLALGEHSGHQHCITGDYELFEDEKGNLFAAVGSDGAVLQHMHESKFISFESKKIVEKADHKPIELEPNKVYKFGIHKRYNPFSKIFERVID